jgi:FAD/FMN-containing dehydrogenase
LVIDNLLEVEMVLADGKIVTASRHKGKRLFWAVRGAGASFGVVTSFTYLGHEQKTPVWGGTLVLKISQLDKVVAFANKFLEVRSPLRPPTSFTLTHSLDARFENALWKRTKSGGSYTWLLYLRVVKSYG